MLQFDVEKIIEDKEKFVFEVVAGENDRIPPFTVTLKKDYYKKLTSESVAPEKLIEKSFEFLLEHEPVEAILKSFNLSVIANYFPEYEKEIGRYFTN